MALFLMAIIPDEKDVTVMLPAGSIAVQSLVDSGDLYSDTDYEDVVLNVVRDLSRKVRRRGWPTSEEGPVVTHEEMVSTGYAGPPLEDEIIEASIEDQMPGCPECGSLMVNTGRRGEVCPNGCGAEVPAPIAVGRSTIYQPTKESPKPTRSSDHLDIIPPTD